MNMQKNSFFFQHRSRVRGFFILFNPNPLNAE